MLEIHIDKIDEMYDEANNRFYSVPEMTILLEHSLLSVSAWEAKWKKPFLTDEQKTIEETIDYIRCMTVTKNVNPVIYYALSAENLEKIKDYIDDPMTATTFSKPKKESVQNAMNRNKKKVTTTEEIYYQMSQYNIPFACEKWHLNRLMTLLKIASIKNQPPKKMSKSDIYSSNRELNNARRKALGTKG